MTGDGGAGRGLLRSTSLLNLCSGGRSTRAFYLLPLTRHVPSSSASSISRRRCRSRSTPCNCARRPSSRRLARTIFAPCSMSWTVTTKVRRRGPGRDRSGWARVRRQRDGTDRSGRGTHSSSYYGTSSSGSLDYDEIMPFFQFTSQCYFGVAASEDDVKDSACVDPRTYCAPHPPRSPTAPSVFMQIDDDFGECGTIAVGDGVDSRTPPAPQTR